MVRQKTMPLETAIRFYWASTGSIVAGFSVSVPALSLLGASRVYGNIICMDCVGVGITFSFFLTNLPRTSQLRACCYSGMSGHDKGKHDFSVRDATLNSALFSLNISWIPKVEKSAQT